MAGYGVRIGNPHYIWNYRNPVYLMVIFRIARLVALFAVLLGGLTAQAQTPRRIRKAVTPVRQSEIDARVDALLVKMTLQEKVGQMAQITLDVIGKGKSVYSSDEPFSLDAKKTRKALVEYGIGSILNTSNNRARTPVFWQEIITQLQFTCLMETRHKVPLLYGIDAIHGPTYIIGGTLMPQQIGLAATFNRELVRQAGQVSAYETRASAVPWTFSPVLDLGADPRNPRQWETFGEDPYVGTELGKALIRGYQGDSNDLANPLHVAACAKHFLGYQSSVSGKDRTNAFISPDALREYHLPAFAAAVKQGAASVMVNSALINGQPVHASYDLLTKLLKQELGFQGLMVTDWGDIDNLYTRDHIATSKKDAIRLAINAGIDMTMIPYDYEAFCDGLVALVKEGKVKQDRIDDAVKRILRVKMRLGLFEQAVTFHRDYPLFGGPEHAQAAYQMAAESITLLKNEGGILPLDKKARILITGPNADNLRCLNGGWSLSWQGDKVDSFATGHTIYKALSQQAGGKVSYVPGVRYKQGGKWFEEEEDRMDEAVSEAKRSDVIVLCLGENSYAEKPGDLNDLYLSDLQMELAHRLAATGKPVVLVLSEGRPRLISKIEPKMKGVVQAYLPGNLGADALAAVLFGDVNPSGRLPYTYPRYPNALTGYIHKYSDEQKKAQGAYDYEADYNPQYPFGHGLSYTSFAYADLKLVSDTISKKGVVTASVTVSNTGTKAGKTAVLVYVSDLQASAIAPDMKRLRAFEKVSLEAGEKKTLTFQIPATDMGYFGPDGHLILESGEYSLQLGDAAATFCIE